MIQLIDLSHPVADLLPIYPGDSPTRLFKTKSFATDLFTNYQLETGMHCGTHLDGPMHLTEKNQLISDLPLKDFIGEGYLLDVRGERKIGMKEQYISHIRAESIVLFYTGQDKLYGTKEYYSSQPEIHQIWLTS